MGNTNAFYNKIMFFPEHEDEVMVGGNEEGIEMIRAKDGMSVVISRLFL